jgi:hypothetical protein
MIFRYPNHEAATSRRPVFDVQRPAEQLDPFCHSRQSKPAACIPGRFRPDSHAVIGNDDVQIAPFASYRNFRMTRAGMAANVGQALLNDTQGAAGQLVR